MPTRAGLLPWNQYTAVSGQYTKKGNLKSTISDGNGMQWDLTTGWHAQRPKGWTKGLKRTCKYITGTDGKTYKLYSYNDYDDYIGFRSHDDPAEEQMAYAEAAFKDKSNFISQKGCGHITNLDYAQKEQVLRVTFEDGTICLFFRLPSAVAGELIALAKSKNTQGAHLRGSKRGQPRHLLGIRFWDLVRIRGMQHGSRYPFEYEKHSTANFIRSLGRHQVTITPEIIEAMSYASNMRTPIKNVLGTRELKPGDKVSVVLNEDEYAEYVEKIRSLNAQLNDKIKSELPSDAAIKTQANLLRNLSMQLDADGEAKYALTEAQARLQAIDMMADSEVAKKYINQRNGKLKDVLQSNNITAKTRAAAGPGFMDAWKEAYAPERDLAISTMGRVWKKQDLINFANVKSPSGDRHISPEDFGTYKMFIDNKDWTGALNFLKSHQAPLIYKTGVRNINLGMQAYASEWDELDNEE